MKEQGGRDVFHEKHFTEEKRIDSKDQTKCTGKCSNDTDYDDRIAALRREIQDWKINEVLTSRTEERLTETPSEHRTFSYASDETTKRQRSPNNPLKSVRTYIDFPAVTNKHDALEYLDLRKEPAIPSSAPCHSKMHSQSACDCYCKVREPTQSHKNETQPERSRVKLVTSKASASKTDAIRSARKVPFTPASPVNDHQPDTKRSTAILPVSPVLSPETSAALEDVDRLVKDAQIQIKAINMVADCSGLKMPVNAYSNEISLDDENDQLLYVRERVAHKFQEANGWIDVNNRGPKNEGISYERRVPDKPKRIIDFSAARFKTFEDRHKEFPRCGPFGIHDLGISTADTQNKGRAEDPSEIPSNERNAKTNTFSVQTCPPVNIERHLTAQNLGSIHISPDPSFIRENANVGTYIVSHGGCAKSQVRKEKFVKIFEEPKDAASNKRSSETQRKKNGKAANEIETSPESSRSSKGTSSGNLLHADEEKETAGISGESKESHKSVSPADVADGLGHRKSEDREVQVEIETIERRTEDGTTEATSNAKSDQKQVRFNEVVQEDTELSSPGEKNGEGRFLQRDAKISVESDDESILKENFDEIERSQDLLPLHDKKKKEARDKEDRDYEHSEIIDRRFASHRRKYCNQNEQSVEDSSLFGSSTIDTSGEGSGHEDDDELYYPSIDELDNVLLAYNKTIDDASRSIRTIDRYLSRPELKEFLQNGEISESNESPKPTRLDRKKVEVPNGEDSIRGHEYNKTIDKHVSRPEFKEFLQNGELSESNESPKPTRLNRKKIEMPKRNSCRYVQSKRNANGKDSIRDYRAVTNKHTNEAHRSKNTRPAQLNSTRRNKLDNNSENKRILPKNVYKTPSRVDSRVTRRRSDADSRTLSTEERRLTESDSDKILRHVEETCANFFKVSRPRDAIVFPARDESSSLTSSVNPSFSSADLQSVDRDKNKTISRVADNNIAEVSSPRSNAAFVQDVEGKRTESKVGFEETLKNAFNVDEMIPILVKNLLQHFQNGATGSPQNLELLITENPSANNVESNVHEMDTARLRTDNESEKECSVFQADATEIVEIEERITEENANDKSARENINFVDKPVSRPSSSEQTASCLKQKSSTVGPRKIDSDVESLRELSSVRRNSTSNGNGKNNDAKSCEYLEQKGSNNGSLAASRNVSSVADKRTDENKTDENICNSSVNNSSAESEGTGSTRPNDSSNDHSSSKPNPVVEDEKIESRLDQAKSKSSVECNDNVRRTSADSLLDCVSLQSSSRSEPKVLNMESTSEIKGSDQFREINNETRSHCRMFQKETILSRLYDEMREQLLHSTHATNYSTLVQQDIRTSEDMPATVSTKIETVSSDTSRSEGELFMPSSGSCSLGEIKMLNTDEQENIISVFVTKETLSLWSESSKSLVQSMGEI
ncbi:uncharacterized protein LOC143365416 [Halictus rubicundus]|uniref:uncharacterized protein LOC143365416 n=1 Tax=Halictus rubicundus TaxID=77578 RepID=UPI0040360B77